MSPFPNLPAPLLCATLFPLPKSCTAPAHDLSLTDQLGVELGPIQRKIDIKVDSVECTLRGIHSLKIFLEVFAGEIRG